MTGFALAQSECDERDDTTHCSNYNSYLDGCNEYYETLGTQDIYDDHICIIDQLENCVPNVPCYTKPSEIPEFGTSAVVAIIAILVISAFIFIRKKN